MRLKQVLVILGLCGLIPSCNIVHYAAVNLTEGPLDEFNDCVEHIRSCRLSDAAWQHIQQAEPDANYSAHYVQGFKEGFVDYLEAGGTGEPPVVPPWRYRKASYETPQGLQAIDDWFAGWRRGASEAQASGFRRYIVVPLALAGNPQQEQTVPATQNTTTEADSEPVPSLPRRLTPDMKDVPVKPANQP